MTIRDHDHQDHGEQFRCRDCEKDVAAAFDTIYCALELLHRHAANGRRIDVDAERLFELMALTLAGRRAHFTNTGLLVEAGKRNWER